MSRVGFVGLGIMGKGMMCNLVTKLQGVESFVIWNRSKDVLAEFEAKFPGKIEIASTAAEVVQKCEVTYSMLSTPEASVAVFDTPEVGLLAGVSAGKTVVDCATLSPERMIQINDVIKARGGKFLEAPVSGSKVPAETGALIFLCGGDEEVFADPNIKAGLEACGKASFHFGPVGSGSRMKLIVNGLMGAMLNTFTESMQLCGAAGLPQEKLIEVLGLGAMANPMFKMKGDNIIANKYDAHFPLKHALKDVRLGLTLAEQLGVSMPVTAASCKSYESILDAHGDEDFSAIMKSSGR